MTRRLENKVAAVTGSGSSIGREICMRLAAEGAKIVGCDVDVEAANATVSAVAAAGGTMVSLQPCDLTDPKEAKRYIEFAIERFQKLDILCNNGAQVWFGSIVDMPPLDFRNTMIGEADIVFNVSQAAWPYLTKSGVGAIVNIASKSGRRGNPMLGSIAHCAGKGAVISMTRQMAVEGAKHGLRVNSISPGLIRTRRTASGSHVSSPDWLARIPLGRIGEPADVANCVLFLASDEASWITGVDIPLDGGSTAI